MYITSSTGALWNSRLPSRPRTTNANVSAACHSTSSGLGLVGSSLARAFKSIDSMALLRRLVIPLLDSLAMAMVVKALVITHRDLTDPTPKAKPFDATGWIWELKHDGYRALLIKEGERLNLLTRRGNNLLSFFPEIAANLRKLPDCAIDGELVMLDEHG